MYNLVVQEGGPSLDDLANDVRREIQRQESRVYIAARELRLKLDKDAKSTGELFDKLAPAFGFLVDPKNCPKVLEVKSGDKEYVSTRRIEGSRIWDSFTRVDGPEGGDVSQADYLASIPADMIEEGQILAFCRPDPAWLECKDPQVEAKIMARIQKPGQYANFNYVAMMDQHPELFKKEEWAPRLISVTLVTKKGGKYYAADLGSTDAEGKKQASVVEFSQLKPTKEGKVEIYYDGRFQSPQELEGHRDYFNKWGRIYVLSEGSSQKEQRKSPDRLAELKLAPIRN